MIHNRAYWHVENLLDGSDEPLVPEEEIRTVCAPDEANLVSSHLLDNDMGLHAPVLDIDMECQLVPSSTEGHFHLYIDKKMTWEDYSKLITVLGEVGILGEFYVTASLARGGTFVRPPWVKKDDAVLVADCDLTAGGDPVAF